MFSATSLAFAGLFSLGLLIWRIKHLDQRKKDEINAGYVSDENGTGSGSMITRNGVSDIETFHRRTIWSWCWLFAQQVAIVIPLAIVVEGIRYKNWLLMDGGAAILLFSALALLALLFVRTKGNPERRGAFTYNSRLMYSLITVGVILLAVGGISQVYWVALPAVICLIVIFIDIGRRNRRAIREFREDNPGNY